MKNGRAKPKRSPDDPEAHGLEVEAAAAAGRFAEPGFLVRSARGISRFHSVTALLNVIVRSHRPVAKRWLRRMRRKYPDATPADVLEVLNGYLKGTVTASGMGVAAGFAAPGLAKLGVVVLASGQALTVAEATAIYASVRAAIYGIDEDESLRKMVLASLMRKTDPQEELEVTETRLRQLLPALVAAVPALELSRGARNTVTTVTGHAAARKLPKKLIKGFPLVAGAALGAKVSAQAADQIIQRADLLFGPPPPWWPAQAP